MASSAKANPRMRRGRLQPVSVPIWREVFFGLDWLSLRASPVYYGAGVPRGDGAPVILLPGFLGSDAYLTEMFYWLRRIGYRAYTSGMGRNAECPNILTERLFETIRAAYQETGRKVHLIGHSLGGTIARSAAIRRPSQVAQVITLAAPFRSVRAHPAVLTVARIVRGGILARDNGSTVDPECYTTACDCAFVRSIRDGKMPATVERVAIYTKTDGVVDWRSCVEEDEKLNIEVASSHIGLAFNPQVYRAIALSLAAVSQGAARGGRAEPNVNVA